MLKKLLLIIAISIFSFADTIRVALAANVTYAINDLIKDFQKEHPDIDVKLNISGSGQLTHQISSGAPFDIFMAANMGYPKALYEKGLSATKPKVYALGSLAILTVRDDLNLSKGLNVLLDSKVSKIAVANPKTAPYGVATKELLQNSNFYDKVKDKFIYGQSIGQTLIYTLKAADIGFIAKSALFSDKLKKYKKGINWEDVDFSKYHPIEQGIILLKRSKDNKSAIAFYNYILSDKAKAIFKKYGYETENGKQKTENWKFSPFSRGS